MIVFDLIFGFLMVFAGRNLFWLCVGVVGFLLGVQSAAALGFSSGGMALLAAFALGILGALLSISFEWFAVVFGIGFLGGGYLLISMLSLMNILPLAAPQGMNAWPFFVIGGIVGMCLMVIIFDWTLIMISSLLGATLIANAFNGTEGLRELLFISSMVTGILVQYLTLKDTAAHEDHSVRRI